MKNKNFYCIVLSKRYANIREKLVNRLNDKDLTTKRGNKYTYGIVNNVMSGIYTDENVEAELFLLAIEAGYTTQHIAEFEASFEKVSEVSEAIL